MQNSWWETLGWRKDTLESRMPGEISITLDMQVTPPLSILTFLWCTLHINSINRVTIYSLDVPLSQFGTSLFFHVWSKRCFLIWKQVSQRQVKWSGNPISLRIFQFVVTHTVKRFSTVNEAEVNIFLEFPCFTYVSIHAGNLISGSSAFSKSG